MTREGSFIKKYVDLVPNLCSTVLITLLKWRLNYISELFPAMVQLSSTGQFSTALLCKIPCTAVKYRTLQLNWNIIELCSVVLYSWVQHILVHHIKVQHSTLEYCTLQYSTVQYSKVQYSSNRRRKRKRRRRRGVGVGDNISERSLGTDSYTGYTGPRWSLLYTGRKWGGWGDNSGTTYTHIHKHNCDSLSQPVSYGYGLGENIF